MGLWLKCPGCQALNPLSVKACPNCGQDLDKLPTKQRVYVIGPQPAPPAPTSPPSETAVPAALKEKPAAKQATELAAGASAAPKPGKKSKRTKKKG